VSEMASSYNALQLDALSSATVGAGGAARSGAACMPKRTRLHQLSKVQFSALATDLAGLLELPIAFGPDLGVEAVAPCGSLRCPGARRERGVRQSLPAGALCSLRGRDAR
jgi:hypothetical protein